MALTQASTTLFLFLSLLAITSGVAQAQDAPFVAPPCDAPPGRGREPTTIDMTAAPEGVPNGAIDAAGRKIGWAHRPRVWRGNRMLPGWSHGIATGMIYTADRIAPVAGVRVAVRNLRLFVKPLRTGAWCLLDATPVPHGALFLENFSGDTSLPAGARAQAGGGVSVGLVAGRNFHFWGRRVAMPAGGVGGVYVEYEARLIADPGTSRAALSRAAYLAAASADYWKSATAPSGHVQVFNEDVAIARFKRIKPRWRLFTMNSNGGPPTAPSPSGG